MSTELVITRGLPASGKTTWARGWVMAEPDRVRVNRDDLRWNLYGAYRLSSHKAEDKVSLAQRAAVAALLRRGVNVVVDDTHLRARYSRPWANLARDLGVGFRVVDLFDVTPEECIARDEARAARGERAVGADVIRTMWTKYLAQRRGQLPPVTPSDDSATSVNVYVPDESNPAAWIVDLDGTLANMGDRAPYAWDAVAGDTPHSHIVDVVRALFIAGPSIIIMSGRDGSCRGATMEWLRVHRVPYDELHMRSAGDNRRDSIVKAELFAPVGVRYNVRGVLDDRDQVVEMWRRMGLPCLQVAPGSF